MNASFSNNIHKHKSLVSRDDRVRLNGHKSAVLWFTGLSGAGKSSVAHAVEKSLHDLGCQAFVFDGDNVRHGLCADLGFSAEDRAENIRRIGELSKLFTETGVIALTAFISPYRVDRDRVRKLVTPGDFIEIYCNCPVEVCEQRDVKGLYAKARSGAIKDFTGVSAPYEPPEAPELVLDTATLSLEECVELVLALLREKGIFRT
jgi:adenylylsulfate kinase